MLDAYVFGPYRLDTATYQLLKDDSAVEVPSKVFDTLLYLLRNRHRVVGKDELLAAVWKDAVVTDDSLVQCISSVRRTLGDDATNPTYVATVARRGYRFIAPVTESAADPKPAAAPSPAPPEPTHTRSVTWLWPVIAIVLLIVGWLAGSRLAPSRSADAAGGTLRFTQEPPPGHRMVSGGALSPDGLQIAFAAQDGASGAVRLWIRSLDAAQARVLEGTDGAARPFWSPDSEAIGFFAKGRLKTVRQSGGPVTDLTFVGPRPSGGAWSPRGQIIYSTWLSGFSTISASGGTPAPLTSLARGEFAHAWPQFLPDGERFIFSVFGPQNRVSVGRLGDGTVTPLVEADPGAVYSPAGYLVFARNGILTAQRFDASSLTMSGEPFGVVSGNVAIPNMTNGTLMSAAAGLLAFGGATGESELAWFDRSGRRLGNISSSSPLHNPALTADQARVFANSYPPGQAGLWVTDLERGATSRLVADSAIPFPSPDGRLVAFATGGADGNSLVRITSVDDGNGAADPPLAAGSESKSVTQWTRDGRFLLFQTLSPRNAHDLWMVPVDRSAPPAPLLQGAANEIQGIVSPDGRWLAYASDESGVWQVYVQAFPSGAQKQLISASGGFAPQWRADGRELFYLSEDHSLMAVSAALGAVPRFGRPEVLFRPEVVGEATTYRTHFAATADGQRFLVDVLQDAALDPITILLNWAR